MLKNALVQVAGDADVECVAAAGYDVGGIAAFVDGCMIQPCLRAVMLKATTGPSTPFATLRSLRMTSFWWGVLNGIICKRTKADLAVRLHCVYVS